MINFEDELKKFSPSMEIEEIEDAVRGHELTDMTDIMLQMMRQQKDAGQSQPVQPVMQQVVQPVMQPVVAPVAPVQVAPVQATPVQAAPVQAAPVQAAPVQAAAAPAPQTDISGTQPLPTII